MKTLFLIRLSFILVGLMSETYASGLIPASQEIYTWKDLSGIWSTAGNWTTTASSPIPDSLRAQVFIPTTSTGRTITLDSNRTIQSLNFSGASALTIAPSASETLTFLGPLTSTITRSSATTALGISTNISIPRGLSVSNPAGQTTTLSGAISGSGFLTMNGSGTVLVSGTNTYSGGTYHTGTGTLQINNSSSLGSGTVYLNSTQSGTITTLSLVGPMSFSSPIVIDATTGRESFATSGGAVTLSSNVTVNASSATTNIMQFYVGNNLALTFSGNITAASNYNGTISFRGGTNATGTYSGVINLASTNTNTNVDHNTGGVWTFTSSGHSFQRMNFVATTANTGIKCGINNCLSTNAYLFWGATAKDYFDLAGYNQSVRYLTNSTLTSGAPVIGNSSTTSDSVLTLIPNAAGTFAGVIQDSIGSGTRKVSLVMNGSSMQTLTGANTYTGTTTILGGNLRINGSLAAGSTVSVNTGTLSGSGTVGGSVTIANSTAAGLSPGAGTVGTMTTGNLTFAGPSANFQIASSGSTVSSVNVNGNVVLNGAALNLPNPLNPGTYTIINYTGTASGSLVQGPINNSGRTVVFNGCSGGSCTITASDKASCSEILAAIPGSPNGIYTIKPGATPFQVYCDMTTDNGGWTLVARALANSGAHVSSAAVGTLTSPTQNSVAKLSDADINSIPMTYMRGTNDAGVTGAYFLASGCTFSATTNGLGCPAKRYLTDPSWTTCMDWNHSGPNTYCVGVGNFNQNSNVDGKYFTYGGADSGDSCRMGMQVPGGDPWCSSGDNGAFWVK